MAKKSFLAVVLSVILAFSAVTFCDLVLTQSSIVAYAASMSAPTVKASNASYKSIKLSWKKVKGAKKYTVLRSTKKSSGYKTIATVTKAEYTDKKASCGKTYYYKVTAVKGSTKKTSKPVKIKCTPAKVSGVKAVSAYCGQATISYKKVSGAGGYEVRYSSSKNGTYKSVSSSVKSTSYTHSIKVGSKGYYKVRAYKTVKGKKVYGPYSSIVSVTARNHSYSQWEQISPATCISQGVESSVCTVCGDVVHRLIGAGTHSYQDSVTAPTCVSQGYTTHTCIYCGVSYQDSFTPATGVHDYGSYTVEVSPTCSTDGSKYAVCSVCGDKHYAVMPATNEHTYSLVTVPANCYEPEKTFKVCSVCGKSVEVSTGSELLSHTASCQYSAESVTADDGTAETHLYDTCSVCGQRFETDTLCLDITDLTADSLANLEGVAKLSTTGNKLTLTATKYVDNFELSGTANDLTISVDAFDDADIKLCGLTITNDGTKATIDDCIRINNKCTEIDDLGVGVVPTVSVSAKDGTENNLIVKLSGGKAIQCETKLELKGHGILNMETVSTSIDARAKLYIRNLTLNIKSGNRGIDTKVDTVDEYGQPDEEYSNIEFGGNATVSINSTDDGIRCKNMEFTAIDTALGDTDSILTIVSGADAIQLEGKKGLTMCQGKVTLTGAKKNLNNKSALVTLSGTAKLVDADGNSLA